MATQLLNADADLATIQDPSGTWSDHHTPTVLLGREPQGPTKLLQGYGGGSAKDAITRGK
jgi:hypothetical protein